MTNNILFRIFLNNMVKVERIQAILNANNINATGLGKLLNVSPSQMSKIMRGEQKLTAESIGEIIQRYKIHPNWIFGYEGDDNTVMYMQDLVHKSELQKKDEELLELVRENASLYKKLATKLEQEVAETRAKYERSQQDDSDQKETIENLKNS